VTWAHDQQKLERVRALMADVGLDALVVRAPDDVLYLTNFWGMKGYDACVFPREGDRCLEIGCGALGWLADVISWGVSARDLHGIDLDAARVASGREKLPGADLRVGDAASLPWPPASFRLAIASTVFSSVLDARVRSAIAEEIVRVLAPGGALIFYDLAVGNPKNPDVLPVPRRDLARLFPTLSVRAVSATLAPPLARAVAPRSVALAHLLEAVPFLRTHVLAILVKRRDA